MRGGVVRNVTCNTDVALTSCRVGCEKDMNKRQFQMMSWPSTGKYKFGNIPVKVWRTGNRNMFVLRLLPNFVMFWSLLGCCRSVISLPGVNLSTCDVSHDIVAVLMPLRSAFISMNDLIGDLLKSISLRMGFWGERTLCRVLKTSWSTKRETAPQIDNSTFGLGYLPLYCSYFYRALKEGISILRGLNFLCCVKESPSNWQNRMVRKEWNTFSNPLSVMLTCSQNNPG